MRWRSLKKAMRWDEEVFGLEYDLDVFNIVAVSDFNMGAMENKGLNVFNTKIRAGQARDGDRHRLPGHRGGDRPRIFPQLDRQPGDLPRLVPAVAEGRADGLPRPGVLGRPGQPRRCGASATCAACARRSFPRMPARSPTRCSPTAIMRIDNFYTATVYNKGAELIRMMHTLIGKRGVPPRHGSLYRAARQPAPRRSRISCGDAGRGGVDLAQFQALVPAGRHAGDHRRGALRPGDPQLRTRRVRNRCRRRPGSRRNSRC